MNSWWGKKKLKCVALFPSDSFRIAFQQFTMYNVQVGLPLFFSSDRDILAIWWIFVFVNNFFLISLSNVNINTSLTLIQIQWIYVAAKQSSALVTIKYFLLIQNYIHSIFSVVWLVDSIVYRVSILLQSTTKTTDTSVVCCVCDVRCTYIVYLGFLGFCLHLT